MEHKQTTLLYNPKIGENVIFSSTAVADGVKIPLKTNNSTNTTFIAKPFYYVSIFPERKGLISYHSPFKFSESAKMKAKIIAIS
jgi:hypothetical protein